MKDTTNVSAILAGEQRYARFRSRHSVTAAAKETGIPTSWVWFWLLTKRFNHQTWLRKVWVRLESVQELFADPEACRNAFYATGEFLTSPEAIRRVAERWPDEPHPYIEFQPPSKLPAQSVKANPVSSEEQKSEVVA